MMNYTDIIFIGVCSIFLICKLYCVYTLVIKVELI